MLSTENNLSNANLRIHSLTMVDSETMSCGSTTASDITEDSQQTMENYGHLLLCPVCKEIITHPVLLPCQHSVCYGCARSQIIAAEARDPSFQGDTPLTPSRNVTPTALGNSTRMRRPLGTSPSASSILSSSSSKRDSGIETSPSITPCLTKGFSFMSTSSFSSIGSTETCLLRASDHDDVSLNSDVSARSRDESKETKLRNEQSRRMISNCYSPRRNYTARQPFNDHGNLVAKSDNSESPSTPESVQKVSRNESDSNGSSVVYVTKDLVHFEACCVNESSDDFLVKGRVNTDNHSPIPTEKIGNQNGNMCKTPNSRGMKQKQKSTGKLPRQKSTGKISGKKSFNSKSSVSSPVSPSDITSENLSRFCTPPPPMSKGSAARNCSQTTSGGLRRSLSTSTIIRSTTMRQQHGADVLKRSRVKSLFCPTCETDIELGKLGIKGLFRNFALEAIVERFRNAAKAAVAIRCGYCKPPASDATKSCLDCKLSYCNECYKTVHVWGTKKAQHEFVGPTNNFSRPKVMLCPEHNLEAVNMYCNRCQRSVCRACKSRGGAHANHSVTSVKNAYKDSKDRLFKSLDILKAKKESTDGAIAQLENDIKAFELEETSVRDEIHSTIDELHKLLEVKRTELLEKADQYARCKENAMRRDLQGLKNNLMYSSVMAFVEEVLLETDPAYFLQTIKMVESRVNEAINHLSILPATSSNEEDVWKSWMRTEECDDVRSMLKLYMNAAPAVKSIEELDFLLSPGVPSIDTPHAAFSTSNSVTLGGNSNSYRWRLNDKSDCAEFYQINYWSSNGGFQENTECHHMPGKVFSIPNNSKLLHQSGNVDVQIRAVNKAGVGQWSDRSIVSSNFIRRANFFWTPTSENYLLKVTDDGKTVKVNEKECLEPFGTDFQFLSGNIELEGGRHYFEVEACGTAEFQFAIGVADLKRKYSPCLHGTVDFCEVLTPESSAMLYCGPKDCYVVNCSGRELGSLPRGRLTFTQSYVVGNGKEKQKTSAFSSLKPLKQLKNTILRRGSKPVHDEKSFVSCHFRSIADGRYGLAPSIELARSSSVTSLPSMLRSQSPVSMESGTDYGQPQSQWNMRAQIGRRCFRIGVEIIAADGNQTEVRFYDVYSQSNLLFTKTITTEYPVNPVFAVYGEGHVSLV